MPQDAIYANQADLARASINAQHLKSWVAGDKVTRRDPDTKTAIERLWQATGRATLSASRERAPAWDGLAGHGVFTLTLLIDLHGAAASTKPRHASVDGLVNYVSNELPHLTLKHFGFEQIPMRDLQGENFPIATLE